MLRYVISLYLFFAVLMTTFFTAYVLSKGRSSYVKIFSGLAFCVSLYLFGYLLEINSSNLQEMIFWNQIQYFGLPFFPVLWMMMALLYTKRIRILRGRTIFFIFFIPILTYFIRLTNSFHHLFYKSWELQPIADFNILYLEKGMWYYVHCTYVMLSLLIANIVFYLKYRKTSRGDQARFLVLFSATFIPYIGLVLILIDFMGLGIDYGALLMPFSILLMMYSMFKYDFLEIKTLAREAVFEKSADGMILLDKEFRIMDYNRAAQDFFSHLNISLQNYPIEDIMAHEQGLLNIIKNKKSGEFRLIKDGQERYYEINSVIIRDSYERKSGMLKSIRDITERRRLQEKLKLMATIDSLSGINNREQFMYLAQKEFARAKRYKQFFSLLMVDIDHFKFINDNYGHAAGDAIIRNIGMLLGNTFRTSDIAGRIGGEEFAILLTNTSLVDAGKAAEYFRDRVAKNKVVYENREICFTISIGVSSFFPEARNFDEILKFADEALYEAKAMGRNKTRCLIR